MSKAYVEVIMCGPFDLVRGFVTGFLLGRGIDRRPFFQVKSGTIRHDTVLGTIKSWLGMENVVPFSIKESLLEDFLAVQKVGQERFGLHIQAVKKINAASFKFDFEIHNQELASECKKLFAAVPADAHLKTDVREESHDEDTAVGYKSVVQAYSFFGRGMVNGNFESVVDLLLDLKHSGFGELVCCHHISLDLEDM